VDAENRAAVCDEVYAFASDEDDRQQMDPRMSGTYAARLPAGRFRFVATRGDVRVEATATLVEGGTQDVVLQFPR
jgi:hypothetical protein